MTLNLDGVSELARPRYTSGRVQTLVTLIIKKLSLWILAASRFTDQRASVSGERDDVLDARWDRFADVGHRSQTPFGNRWSSPRFMLT